MGDAEILHPDRVIEIGGREVTVREFSFRDSLDLGPLLSSMLSDIDNAVGDGTDLSGLFEAFYAHPDALEAVLLKCTGQDKEWIDSLTSEEGEMIVMSMFEVNGPFFVRRVAARRMMAAAAPRSEKSI